MSAQPERQVAGAIGGQPGRQRRTIFRARGLTKVYRSGEIEVHALRGVDLDPIEAWGGGEVLNARVRRVEARITIWQGEDVLLVPLSALFREGRDWAVFVVEDGRARLRRVEFGHRSNLEAELVAGRDRPADRDASE
jgi:hypothetical protein